MEMSIDGLLVTLYTLPDGRKSDLVVKNITLDDELYFKERALSVSMEQLRGGEYVVYSTTGKFDDEGDDIEVTYIVPEGQDCVTAMSEVRKRVEGIRNESSL